MHESDVDTRHQALTLNGADVTAGDDKGWTAFHWAAYHNHYHCLSALLKASARDPNAVKDNLGETPLCLAERWDRTESIVLLKGGSLPRVRSISRSITILRLLPPSLLRCFRVCCMMVIIVLPQELGLGAEIGLMDEDDKEEVPVSPRRTRSATDTTESFDSENVVWETYAVGVFITCVEHVCDPLCVVAGVIAVYRTT